MKIEKLSESQVKFTLSKSDLTERNVNIHELLKSSFKAQSLFREMMEQANEVYGFEVDNTPLMIEAMPSAFGSVSIIVTKIDVSEQEESYGQTQELPPMPILKKLNQFSKDGASAQKEQFRQAEEKISIHSFPSLDDVTAVSIRLENLFFGTSTLVKTQGRYYLVLEDFDIEAGLSMPDTEAVLSEFGRKHVSNLISKQHLLEHGELLIKSKAIFVMANLN